MKIKRSQQSLFFLLCSSTFILLLFLSSLSLAIYLTSNRLLFPKKPTLEKRHLQIIQNPQHFGFILQPFTVKTKDNLQIEAYLISPSHLSQESSRGTILMLHGISGIKEHNFAIAERFVAAGFHCITYDSRSHGESSGQFVTYGLQEVTDASLILDRASRLFGEGLAPYHLFGISLGASVGLQLSPQDSRIQKAVIVSPFANLKRLIEEQGQPYLGEISASLFASLLFWFSQQRTGFSLHQVNPIAAAKKIEIPILIVHGENDPFTAIDHGKQIYAAIPSSQKVWRIVPEGNHHQVLMQGGDELYREMVEFFRH